jgi:iron complex outermembrane receptor protein
MRSRTPALSILATSIAAVLAGASAEAQQSTGLEEIVVTARQRAELLTDVPATVTAFTQADIDSAGIERPEDFIALTPGLSVVNTAEVGDMQVNIRGINTGRDAETNFALVIDGVLQTNVTALNQELANVTQIEVLKGPQGALYGRNALAGALILTTRKPGDEFEANIEAGYGNNSTYNGRLYLAGPLSENISASLTPYTYNTDGHYDNSLLGCDDCVDFLEENGVLGRLVWNLDNGEIDVKAKYSKIDSGAINFNASLALKEAAQGFDPGNASPFLPLWEDPNSHDFIYLNNVKPQNEQENINLSIKGDFDVGLGTLTTILAYNEQDNFFLTDGTSAAFGLYAINPACIDSNAARSADTPLPLPFSYSNDPDTGAVTSFLPPYSPVTCDGYQYQERNQTDTSVEIRLTSPGDQSLRWVAGLYWADIERDQIVSQGSDNDQGFLTQGLVLSNGPNPTDLLYDDKFESTVYAVFGQLAYDLTDSLELALALRFDREEREVKNNVPKIGPQTPGFLGTGQFINPTYDANPSLESIPNRDLNFEQWQPKLTLNWNLNDDVSMFASYGIGFRSGGFNSQGSAATIEQNYGALCLGATEFPGGFPQPPTCGADSVRNITNVRDDYDKEVSQAAEIGFKSTLLDRTLSVNGAVYYTQVDDMQYFNFFAGPFGLLRVVTNLDEVTIQGAEIDFKWLATDSLSFFGGFAYTDSEIDKYSGRPYTEGNKVPYVPEYTGNLGTELRLALGGSDIDFVTRIDGIFVGETWFHPVQEEQVPNLFSFFGFGQGEFSKMKRDAYALVNARIGLEGDRWGVTLWGRNLTDEEYLQEIIPAPEFGGSFIHNSPARSYGVEVRYSF